MGALIMLGVFIVIAASAVRIKSRQQEADVVALKTQVEETMLLAERESSEEARIALLLEARDMVDQAIEIQGDDVGLRELSERLQTQWDAATGEVRILFGVEQKLTVGEGAPQGILIHEDQLHVLNAGGQRLYRYPLDQEGEPVTNQGPWIWELQGETDTVSPGRIVDMEWVDAGNGRLTPALLMLTVEDSLLELNTAGVARDVAISDVLRWQSALAIKTYHGNLYVLDLGRENIAKYVPTGDDYANPPVDWFQGSPDIPWANVIDMAIDGSVYLLLSNGSIMKFAAGEPEAFTQEGLYPALEHPVAMFASPDSGSVFVAEPAQARVVEFSTSGHFIRQFRAASGGETPFEDLVAFGVDLRHDRLFIGTAAGLHSASLPSLQ
jgi:hypothetical protein